LNDAHTFGQKIGFQEKQALEAEWMADRWNDTEIKNQNEAMKFLCGFKQQINGNLWALVNTEERW